MIQAWAVNPKAVAKDQPDRPKKNPRPVYNPPTPTPREAWGFPFTALAAMAEPGLAGIGDTVHRKLGVGGVLFKATLQTFGISCGCDTGAMNGTSDIPMPATTCTYRPPA